MSNSIKWASFQLLILLCYSELISPLQKFFHEGVRGLFFVRRGNVPEGAGASVDASVGLRPEDAATTVVA